MIRKTRAAAVVAVAIVGLAACGSPSDNNAGESGNNNSGGGSTTQQKATDAAAKGPAKDIEGAQKGGNVSVYAETTPSTFDPTNIYYVDGNQIAKLTFRALTQFDIRGGKPVLVPDLAEDLGTKSADGLTWTFKLKKGIKYQDGTPVKAADYAYAIKRSFAHDVYKDGPTYQLDTFLDGDKYKGPYKSGDNYAGVQTPDDNTLVIKLKQRFDDLPYYASFPMFTPIPKAKDTKDQYDKNPMSTGPYQFAGYNPGKQLKLKKNPNWDPNTDPVRHQYVDGWDFTWGNDRVTMQKQVLASQGKDATAIEYDNVDSSLVPDLQGKDSQMVKGDSPCTYIDQMDTRKIPLEVRKIVAKSYDFDALNKAAGNSPLTAAPATSIMPSAVPGHAKFTVGTLTGQGRGDAAGAKADLQAYLKKAGKPNFTLSWYYANDDQVAIATTNARKTFFTKAGFTVKPVGVPKAKLRSLANDYSAKGSEQINFLWTPRGWCSDWPSGSSWFPVLFKSNGVPNLNSVGQLQDKALDARIDAVGKLPLDKQAAEWGKLDKEILEKYLPGVPWYYSKNANIIGTKVGGAVNDPTQGLPIFTQLYVKK